MYFLIVRILTRKSVAYTTDLKALFRAYQYENISNTPRLDRGERNADSAGPLIWQAVGKRPRAGQESRRTPFQRTHRCHILKPSGACRPHCTGDSEAAWSESNL